MCLKLWFACSVFIFLLVFTRLRISCRNGFCVPSLVLHPFLPPFVGVSAQLPDDFGRLEVFGWKYTTSNPQYPSPYDWKYPGHLAVRITYNNEIETLSLGANLTEFSRSGLSLSKPIYYVNDIGRADCTIWSNSKLLNFPAGMAKIKEIKASIDRKDSRYSFLDKDPSHTLLNCVTSTLDVLQAIGLPLTFELHNPWVIFHVLATNLQFDPPYCLQSELQAEFKDIRVTDPAQYRHKQEAQLKLELWDSFKVDGRLIFAAVLVVLCCWSIVVLFMLCCWSMWRTCVVGQVGGGQVGGGQVGGGQVGGAVKGSGRYRKRPRRR